MHFSPTFCYFISLRSKYSPRQFYWRNIHKIYERGVKRTQ
jgi:hypothetical protein